MILILIYIFLSRDAWVRVTVAKYYVWLIVKTQNDVDLIYYFGHRKSLLGHFMLHVPQNNVLRLS